MGIRSLYLTCGTLKSTVFWAFRLVDIVYISISRGRGQLNPCLYFTRRVGILEGLENKNSIIYTNKTKTTRRYSRASAICSTPAPLHPQNGPTCPSRSLVAAHTATVATTRDRDREAALGSTFKGRPGTTLARSIEEEEGAESTAV